MNLIPKSVENATIKVAGKSLPLTNLNKVFWPKLDLRKRDLLEYYEAIAPALLPHVRDRAMVMKRYPNGIDGEFFFMKRTPASRPSWLKTCPVRHGKDVIFFPLVNDLASLLWLINLGCIDLNPWYGFCDSPDQPDVLHFDLDPEKEAPFALVREAALIVRDGLEGLGMTAFAKTSGGRGMHIYAGIKRGPAQHEVWAFSKTLGHELARAHRDVFTVEYKVANRPRDKVHLDYNQNRSGATLASIYSVRPNAFAGVSMPVSWDEVEGGIEPPDFTMLNALKRVKKVGDLWKPLTQSRGRFDLQPLIARL
ncbi:MAG TPA: non-homologous end-joining DNA ligase [Candidatus Rubrimentiphilum sp.]|nr:non-homologous end-joining DNA ligase [Candidatus Rubrimentiphilum sp.]